MVKVQAFQGYTLDTEIFNEFLPHDMEHLPNYSPQKLKSEALLSSGKLHKDPVPCFYLYQQTHLGVTSIGVMAELSVEDYAKGFIKKHEQTLYRPHHNAETYAADHIGPVVVGYRSDLTIDIKFNILVEEIQRTVPFMEWETVDKRKHCLWKCQNSFLSDLFIQIPSFYILDGHHRFQAALANNQRLGEHCHEAKWIQGIIYSSTQIRTFPQHRKIKQMPHNLNMLEFLEQNQRVRVKKVDPEGQERFQIIYQENGESFGVEFLDQGGNKMQNLSPNQLKNQILLPIFGNQKSIEENLSFLPGITQDNTAHSTSPIFLLNSLSIEEIFDIADKNLITPPKATWIEPKPCMHMVYYLPLK